MKPNYGQALYDDFIHCAKALPVDADIFHVKDIYDNDSIIKQFSNGVRKPLIDINTTGFEGLLLLSEIASLLNLAVVTNIPFCPNGIVPFNSRILVTGIVEVGSNLLA